MFYRNKVYCPNHCEFVSSKINTIFPQLNEDRKLPRGVVKGAIGIKTFGANKFIKVGRTHKPVWFISIHDASNEYINTKTAELNLIINSDSSIDLDLRLGLFRCLDELKKYNKRKCAEWLKDNG